MSDLARTLTVRETPVRGIAEVLATIPINADLLRNTNDLLTARATLNGLTS